MTGTDGAMGLTTRWTRRASVAAVAGPGSLYTIEYVIGARQVWQRTDSAKHTAWA